jgi:hypothetical protein
VLEAVLDEDGKFKSPDRRDRIKLKQKKKDGTWKLSVVRKKSDFAAGLSDEGLLDEDNAKPGKAVTVRVEIGAAGLTYARDFPLTYRSKAGKKGTAK